MVCWSFLPAKALVYHAMATDTAVHDTLKVMEYKLFSYIMQPAAIITIAAGVWMIWLWNWRYHRGFIGSSD